MPGHFYPEAVQEAVDRHIRYAFYEGEDGEYVDEEGYWKALLASDQDAPEHDLGGEG